MLLAADRMSNCTVRALELADLPMVLAWRNHPEVRRFMFTQHEIGFEEHQRWFARSASDRTRRLLIGELAREAIGFVQFSNVSPGAVAHWGFYVNPDAPRGTGQQLGRAALDHAFNDLGLYKVCGQALEGNHASIALHKKVGFKQEGTLRDQHVEGASHTLICFGLLAQDWRLVRSNEGNGHAQD